MIYLLPLLAVITGFLIALWIKPSSHTGFQLLLSFSGAFLLAVTVFELLPEVYAHRDPHVGIFIMLGLLVQILLEFLSKGVEHGHSHHESVGKFPVILLLSLSVHALLEGFPLVGNRDLLYGVVIHKIPVAAILSFFLLHANLKKIQVLAFLVIFALMTPLGSWGHIVSESLDNYGIYISSMVIGIFLHVSTTILFEASKNHSFNASKLLVVVAGIFLAYFL